ncbi:MAG: 1-acyl-sn-glycerol-3-phosphate acyltransferase [Bacteroidales bacterium]|nr:1-acyl-sn-glycerol-3-phosphate acyltransferase [Candidatus Cacconaster merdequi]
MGSKTKIYEKSRWYDFAHAIANLYIHDSFRIYRCIGKENIPSDGAIIFACNHCAALMDPLAVLALDNSRKVFVARADIFNAATEWILSFMKILPIHRIRDGLHNVVKTEETIEKSIEVLEHDTRFGIMPEGKHRPMHSLLPLGKGLSRIALGADRKLKGNKRVYIIPVGCEYGDYFRYRSSLLLQIGKPIDVSAYVEHHADATDNELLQGIREVTAEKLRNLIVYIPDDDDYQAIWTLSKISTGRKIPFRKLQERFAANRSYVERALKFRETSPEEASELFSKAISFEKKRVGAKISLNAFHSRNHLKRAVCLTLESLLLLPLFLAAATVSLPSWVTAELLASKCKDHAFKNSIRCATFVALWSLTLVFAFIPAPFFTYDYFEIIRQTASAWRILFKKDLRKEYETLISAADSIPDAL